MPTALVLHVVFLVRHMLAARFYHGLQPDVPRSFPSIPHSQQISTMARKSNTAAALQNPTRAETSFRDFAYSNLTPEQSSQRAAPLLSSRELLRNVRGLAPEDQTKFIEKVDKVC